MNPRKNNKNRLSIFLELMEIMEQAFIYKLKKKNANITEQEIKEKIQAWYTTRPGAELGDGEGTPGEISRFNK